MDLNLNSKFVLVNFDYKNKYSNLVRLFLNFDSNCMALSTNKTRKEGSLPLILQIC